MIRERLVIAGIVIACLTGCLPMVPAKTGEPIRDETVGTLRPGITTRQELFEQLGPPSAIVRPHEIAAVLTPGSLKAVAPATSFKLVSGEYRFQTDTFFALFARDPGSEYQRIYYYDYIVSRVTGHCFLFVIYDTGETSTDRLWVLVDEKTGIVQDFAFKKQNQKTVFGRPD